MGEPGRMNRLWEDAKKHNPVVRAVCEALDRVGADDDRLTQELWDQAYSAGHQGGYTEGLRDAEREGGW